MKLLIKVSLALLLLAPLHAMAQGVRYDNIALLDSGRPAQGIGIRVCSSGSTGTPCTPAASIFSDSALTLAITQPGFQSDAQGNYNFYAACGKYDIQLTGNGVTTKTLKDVQLGPCGLAVVPGVGQIVAKVDRTAQSANIAQTLLYTVPANGAGMYRAIAYVEVTTAATTSSTLPSAQVFFTNVESGTFTGGNATTALSNNVVGLNSAQAASPGATMIMNAKAGTAINYATANYASVGATAMQYSVHVKLEYLGN